MSEIKAGDCVKVPAGTVVQEYVSYKWRDGKASTRDVIVEVTRVIDALRKNTYDYADLPHIRPKIECLKLDGRDPDAYWDKVREIISPDFPDEVYVEWSNGKKRAKLSAVVLATDDEKSKRAEKATKGAKTREDAPPTIRQQMVKGSKWRFTEDAEIMVWYDNPAYNNFIRNYWDAYRKQHGAAMGGDALGAVKAAGIPPHIAQSAGKATKGREFTVSGKMHQSYVSANGLIVPCTFISPDGTKKEHHLPFKEIEKRVEAVDIPTVNIYVLRDTTTGKFYSKTNAIYDLMTKKTTDEKGCSYIGGSTTCDEALANVKWEEKWSKAKQFDKLGVLRTFLLGLAGYFEGIQQEADYFVEAPDRKVFDIPTTWEIVKIEKLSKKEVSTLEIHDSLNASFRLRGLTVTYGSAVRSCYKALEKKGSADSYKGMIVFRSPLHIDTGTYNNGQEWRNEWREELEDHPEWVEAVDKAIKETGAKRGTFTRAKDVDSIAVAYPTVGEAVQLRLLYEGTMEVHVIDLDQMAEVVEGQK